MKINPKSGFQVIHATMQTTCSFHKNLTFFNQYDVILSRRISHPIKESNRHISISTKIPKNILPIRLVEHQIPKMQYTAKITPSFIFIPPYKIYILECSSYFHYTISSVLCQFISFLACSLVILYYLYHFCTFQLF